MSAIVPVPEIDLSLENAEALLSRPLFAAPAALRPAIYPVWVLNQHLFPSPLPIAASLAIDTKSGLTTEDAVAILDAMMQPDVRHRFRFASEFMTELGRRTALAIKQRKMQAEQAERRAEYTPPLPPASRPERANEFAEPSDAEVAWQKSKLREIAERVGEKV